MLWYQGEGESAQSSEKPLGLSMWIQPEPQTIHGSIQMLRTYRLRTWIGLEDLENVRTACSAFMLRDYP